jgi:MFS family permease
VSRVIEAAFPARLGQSFRVLVASSWFTNLGDGIGLAAAPLIVASQTDDEVLVALAGTVQFLPWVLFALVAGVAADRFDRRRILRNVNLLRVVVLTALAVGVTQNAVGIVGVLVALFVLGTAETVIDITAGTLLPMVVPSNELPFANARLTVGHVTLNQLVGPPLGAFLFAAGAASPLVAQAMLVALGVVFVTRIGFVAKPERVANDRIRTEIRDGARWLWAHAAVRTLTLTVLAFNVTFGSTVSLMVLYSERRLGLGPVGFGLLTTAGALGGIAGAAAYARWERRFGMAVLMRIGLVVETLTHLTLALTTVPIVAIAILTLFGVHESVWSTTVNTIRQRAVPLEFQGRVGSIYLLATMGGLAIGAALGGLIARTWGITAPFWFAFGGSIVILSCIWGSLRALVTVDAAGQASPS